MLGYRCFWRFFAKFIKILLLPKESFTPQTLTLPFKLGETGSSFGGSFDGLENLQGVFHPWKFGKDLTRNGYPTTSNDNGSRQPTTTESAINDEYASTLGEIRGPILGFQIPDNTCAMFNGEAARGRTRKLADQTRSFSSYSSSQWVSQWDFWPLQAPKPLGVESQHFIHR